MFTQATFKKRIVEATKSFPSCKENRGIKASDYSVVAALAHFFFITKFPYIVLLKQDLRKSSF